MHEHKKQHPALAAGRWHTLTFAEQLGNIGSEVDRALRAGERDDEPGREGALQRTLELFDLTTADQRWRGRCREVLRAREVVCDFFYGDNNYHSTADFLSAYFLDFAVAARRNR